MVFSNAKLTVLAAALAAAGATLHTVEAPPIAVALLMVTCLIGFIYQFKRRPDEISATAPAHSLLLRRASVALLLSLIPCTIYYYAALRSSPASNDIAKYSGQDVIFNATAKRNACATANRELVVVCRLLLFPKLQQLSGKTLLRFKDLPTELAEGAKKDDSEINLQIRGHILAPRKNVPAWDYDRSKNLLAQGIYSTCSADKQCENEGVSVIKPDALKRSSNSSNFANQLTALASDYEASMSTARASIVETHRKFLPAKLADLLSSIVLGNRAVSLSPDTTHQFRDVGLSHILAASGFNLTIVTVMTFALCRLVTPSTILCNTMCMVSMLGFVSLAGPSPSVVRAALMCSIMLIAKSGQRRTPVLSALAFAFILTVITDPLCTNDLGLQLSYAATVGIVLGSRALTAQIYSGKTRWKHALADAISVVLIAQFSVMPIQLFFFWRAGIMFIPANLLVTPLVTPLTMAGFASSTLALLNKDLAPVHVIIAFIDALAFIPLTAMVLSVKAFGAVEAANFVLGPPSNACVVLYYGSFLFLIHALRVQQKTKLAKFVFVCALALLLWRPFQPWLTVAEVHGHTVLINSQREGIDIDSTDPQKPSKIVERFLSFCGAHSSQSSFKIEHLRSGCTSVHSENWLLVMLPHTRLPCKVWHAAEILLIARKLQCDRIFIMTPDTNSDNELPSCEYKLVNPDPDRDLRLLCGRYRNAVMFCKRKR